MRFVNFLYSVPYIVSCFNRITVLCNLACAFQRSRCANSSTRNYCSEQMKPLLYDLPKFFVFFVCLFCCHFFLPLKMAAGSREVVSSSAFLCGWLHLSAARHAWYEHYTDFSSKESANTNCLPASFQRENIRLLRSLGALLLFRNRSRSQSCCPLER